jgi:hypothetical protein
MQPLGQPEALGPEAKQRFEWLRQRFFWDTRDGAFGPDPKCLGNALLALFLFEYVDRYQLQGLFSPELNGWLWDILSRLPGIEKEKAKLGDIGVFDDRRHAVLVAEIVDLKYPELLYFEFHRGSGRLCLPKKRRGWPFWQDVVVCLEDFATAVKGVALPPVPLFLESWRRVQRDYDPATCEVEEGYLKVEAGSWVLLLSCSYPSRIQEEHTRGYVLCKKGATVGLVPAHLVVRF